MCIWLHIFQTWHLGISKARFKAGRGLELSSQALEEAVIMRV